MKGRHCITTLAGAKDRALGRLKNYLEQRTPRQRLYIVLTALLLFAAVDIWMIVSFRGTPNRCLRNTSKYQYH